MTPTERITALKELLPGLRSIVYEILAADTNIVTDGIDWKIDFTEPLVDVMGRLRFNDVKIQRVTNHCGAAGGVKLKSAYWVFKQRLNKEEVTDFAVAAEVVNGLQPSTPEETKGAIEVVNELVESRETGFEHVKFDLVKVQRMMAVERRLKHRGNIKMTTPMREAVQMVRQWVNRWEKMELRSPNITIEEVFGEVKPRADFPNMLFGDNRFGDGTRWHQVTNTAGEQVWQRSSLIEPLVPEFEGQDPEMIKAELIRRVKERAKKAG